MLERLGLFAVEAPWQMLVRTGAVALLVVAAAIAWHGSLTDALSVDGADSQRATDFELAAFPERLAATADVVLVADEGRVDTDTARREVAAALSKVSRLRGVAFVEAPFNPDLISTDGTAVILPVQYDPRKLDDTSVAALRATFAGVQGVTTEVGGTMPEIASDPDAGSEVVGLLAALVILLIVFGSVVAAGLPLLLAIASLGVGVCGVLLLARVADVSTLAPQLAGIIGLGVGIDYALIVITRYRELVSEGGIDRQSAIVETMRTAGHSVVVAGGIVVISMCGLFVTGVEALTTMGIATAICVLATMIGTVTALPAVLVLLGPRLDSGRLLKRSAGNRAPRSRWARFAVRHPVPTFAATIGLLLLLAAPAFSIEVGYNDASSSPRTSTARRANDALVEHFGPGYTTSIEAVIELASGAPGDRGPTADRLAAAIGQTKGVAAVLPADFGHAGEQAAIRVFPTTGTQDPVTGDTIERIRTTVLPAVTEDTGTHAWVGGATATRIDFARRVQSRLPLMIVAVVGMSVLLLMVAFRSVVVAVKAAVLNLLSIGAAYGVVVAVFQWGWGASLLGLDGTTPIDAYVPIFLFAILFGLSMDYEVFILSRIRERYDATGDNSRSIVEGVDATARIVTSAALIMAGVFASFLLGGDAVVKMFGVGLTTAVLVDATIVRLLLLPAAMTLLGDANWWAPRWLRRAQGTTIEPSAAIST